MEMGFQPHYTEEQKEKRRNKYRELRDAGIEADEARVYRDWTDEKVRRICAKECKPIPKWK